MRALAPAKLNLTLAVLRRRPDGRHLVDTWMVPLADLHDELTVGAGTPGAGPIVRCPARPDLETPRNLAARAALAYAEAAAARGRPLLPGAVDLDIAIDKRIPVEAGLGGGSSDAAAMLRLLEEAHGALGPEALVETAAGLGADVPFFLRGGPARASGIGEVLAAAQWPDARWAALAAPARGLRTADVYRRYDALAAARAGARHGAAFFNDLEAAAIDLCPEIAPLIEALRGAGATAAQVSGSGSACFGLFGDETGARSAARAAASAGAAWTWVSRIGDPEGAW